MPTQRRIFDKDFKLRVLAELDAGGTVASVAREHGIHPETIRLWKTRLRKYGDRAFAGHGNAYTDEARIAELERVLGQMAAENALLKKAIKTLQLLNRKGDGRR